MINTSADWSEDTSGGLATVEEIDRLFQTIWDRKPEHIYFALTAYCTDCHEDVLAKLPRIVRPRRGRKRLSGSALPAGARSTSSPEANPGYSQSSRRSPDPRPGLLLA